MIRIGDLTNIVVYMCACLGYLAVARHTGWLTGAGFWALWAAAAIRDHGRRFTVPRWLLNLVALAILAHAFSRVQLDYLVEPVLDGLVLLVGIKLLEVKGNRDYLQVLALCAFLLLGASLLSIRVSFLVYYGLLAFLSTLALLFLTAHARSPDLIVERGQLMQWLLLCMIICSMALPASGLFFVVLPRTDYPLLSFLNKVSKAKSGFSDSISLGQVADIQEDRSVIFRAEMEQIGDEQLYWRGIILDLFDGKAWRSSRPEPLKGMEELGEGTIQQTIYIEPYGNKVLFALDRPIALWILEKGREREVTQFQQPVVERLRYKAVSSLHGFRLGAEEHDSRYLQLPSEISPGIRELVLSQASGGDQIRKAFALLNFFRRHEFTYSIEDLPVSATPLEDFLMDQRRGNCEYFASALGVMLRMAGIPSRLVAGYRGGLYNRSGRYYLVQQNNAHVWVEAQLNDFGWIRLDPTPLSTDSGPLMPGADFLNRVRVLMDTFNHYWIKFVINYDLERQFRMLRGVRDGLANVGFRRQTDRATLRKIGVISGIVTALIAAVLWFVRRKTDPETELAGRFLLRMKKRGYLKGDSEGLDELMARIENAELRDRACRFVDEFQGFFYRDRSISREDRKRLRAMIEEL